MWEDGRLDWSANPTYSAIDYIFSSSDFTWRPTLIVVNAYVVYSSEGGLLVFSFILQNIDFSLIMAVALPIGGWNLGFGRKPLTCRHKH